MSGYSWSPTSTLLVGFAALAFVAKWATGIQGLWSIPTIGYADPILSWLSALKFLGYAREMIMEGYEKARFSPSLCIRARLHLAVLQHKPGVFKIPVMDGWLVVAAGRQEIEDISKAPDNMLSFAKGADRAFEMTYTFGREIAMNQYHANVIRGQFTRHIGVLFDEVYDEMVAAFNDIVPAEVERSWVKFKTTTALQRIVSRVSNRVFIGLPLCRDEDYMSLNIQFTTDVAVGSMVLRQFPEFLKPLVCHVLTNVPRQTRRAVGHLGPLIRERQRVIAESREERADKPKDLLQWLIEAGEETSDELLSKRVLAMNFAAIHTSSQALTQTLYYLAENPLYADILREEVGQVVANNGWTKSAIGKLHKVDSFLKEAQRMDGLTASSMARYSLKPFRFSNGVTIPAGVMVCAAARGAHYDPSNYENPELFDPWRFANLRDRAGEDRRHQLVTTCPEFLDFGHGRHACPGRFFAANEIKAILAYMVLNYDIKLEGDTKYPVHRYIGVACVPANINLLLRKRKSC
ncbi:cytochrome P450 [Vararia minispora EC-137]|uniref:Cytochrome P450 n=1 Tax=Vararia minispora EC-137 TaxID=1314806 RepID=A0ACB8QPV1_9AGAM|nr:cytochrome P450 [Vararia minispora EC-137]